MEEHKREGGETKRGNESKNWERKPRRSSYNVGERNSNKQSDAERCLERGVIGVTQVPLDATPPRGNCSENNGYQQSTTESAYLQK